MSVTEPTPYWGWIIKGHGGALAIQEALLRDQAQLNPTQAMCVEFQLARLRAIWERVAATTDGYDRETPRTLEELQRIKNFMDEDVLWRGGLADLQRDEALMESITPLDGQSDTDVLPEPPYEAVGSCELANPTPEQIDAMQRAGGGSSEGSL